MIEVILSSLTSLISPEHILFLAIGVLLGLIVGIIPGLGGIVGLSLLLPFLYGMDTISALACLIGLVSVIPTSATFTSILMGVPGSSSSQATVLDGFPLAKRGEAARALSAAFFSSLAGGLFGAVILTFFVQIARPLILLFASPELFMLSIFGLSMVGTLSGRSVAKGIASCGLGMLIGAIGSTPATGEFRMVYGISYLYDGIPLVIVALAIFAMPEIVELMRKQSAIAGTAKLKSGGMFNGIKDVIKNRWLVLRCSSIGTIIGAIPGMGGSVVDWIAYSHAKQSIKDTSNLGKGDIRGVIAPESANNAKEGGALLPTLLFGIPGSGAMAVFLGGMVLIGIEAGPSMVTTDISLTYTIIWSLAIANILGAGLSIMLSKHIAKLTQIKFSLLAPFIIIILSFASFQATKDIIDLWAFLLIGIIGIFMKRFDWSRPAFLIGFVLAPQSESYLYQAVQFYGFDMFTRPGVVVIIICTILSVYFSRRTKANDQPTAIDNAKADSKKPQIIFVVFILLIFVLALVDAFQHTFLGGLFPAFIAITIIPVIAYILYQHLKVGDNINSVDFELTQEYRQLPSYWQPVFWFIGLYLATYIIGLVPAAVLFFITFLHINAAVSWQKNIILTIVGIIFLLAFAYFLNLNFPSSVFL